VPLGIGKWDLFVKSSRVVEPTAESNVARLEKVVIDTAFEGSSIASIDKAEKPVRAKALASWGGKLFHCFSGDEFELDPRFIHIIYPN
jgi:hypothetical protein